MVDDFITQLDNIENEDDFIFTLALINSTLSKKQLKELKQKLNPLSMDNPIWFRRSQIDYIWFKSTVKGRIFCMVNAKPYYI